MAAEQREPAARDGVGLGGDERHEVGGEIAAGVLFVDGGDRWCGEVGETAPDQVGGRARLDVHRVFAVESDARTGGAVGTDHVLEQSPLRIGVVRGEASGRDRAALEGEVLARCRLLEGDVVQQAPDVEELLVQVVDPVGGGERPPERPGPASVALDARVLGEAVRFRRPHGGTVGRARHRWRVGRPPAGDQTEPVDRRGGQLPVDGAAQDPPLAGFESTPGVVEPTDATEPVLVGHRGRGGHGFHCRRWPVAAQRRGTHDFRHRLGISAVLQS